MLSSLQTPEFYVVRDGGVPTIQLSVLFDESNSAGCPVNLFLDGNLTDFAEGSFSDKVNLSVDGRILISNDRITLR